MSFPLLISVLLLYIVIIKCDDNQLIIVQTENSTQIDELNYSDQKSPVKIFQATKEWKEINDEILPKGLHVRINLETGKKEAKLIENVDEIDVNSQVTTKYQIATMSSSNNVILSEAEDRFLREINKLNQQKISNSAQQRVGRSQILQAEIKSESEILRGLLNKYSNSNTEFNEKLSILVDLEYLVHTGDVGKDFYDLDGFDILLKDLNQTKNNQLKMDILSVFGSAIQSNVYVKMELSKTNFLLKIVSMLEYIDEISILRKCFFVLSALLRNSPSEQVKFFNDYGGIKLFKNLFDRDLKLAVKISTLLSDITSEISYNPSNNETREFIKTNFMDNVICLKIIQILENDLDCSNLILLLESMLSLTNICKNEFINNIHLIRDIHSKYKSVNEEFIEKATKTLLNSLNVSKDEL